MGFEPTTTCLGSKDSTTELRPPLAEEETNPTPEPLLSQGNRRGPLTPYTQPPQIYGGRHAYKAASRPLTGSRHWHP